jgi:hypothetical protein
VSRAGGLHHPAAYLLAGMLFSFVYVVIGAIDADALFAEVTTET